MKKSVKILLIIVLALVLAAAIICAILFTSYKSNYIGTDAAFEIALEDSGLSITEIIDRDVEFEKTRYSAWYEIDFDTHGMEYSYSVDAVSGEILHKSEKPDR